MLLQNGSDDDFAQESLKTWLCVAPQRWDPVEYPICDRLVTRSMAGYGVFELLIYFDEDKSKSKDDSD